MWYTLYMSREQDRQKLYGFMISKGADKFWTNTALRHIMLNFAGNTYWVTNITYPKVTVGEFGMIDKFTVRCLINTEQGSKAGMLTYTFCDGHKVVIRPK